MSAKLHTCVNNELLERYRAKQDEVVEERHSEAAQVMIAAKARAAEHEVLAEGLSRQLRDVRKCESCGFGPVEHRTARTCSCTTDRVGSAAHALGAAGSRRTARHPDRGGRAHCMHTQ